jgi:hypothetical protein
MNYLQKKKTVFMSIVNKTKGFVRTISNVPPLTIYDCVDEDSIINYSIRGNSIQDGTPTPDAPINVESVGEKTINLFNPEDIIAKFEGDDTYKTGAYLCTSIQLKPNTQYYMKTFNPTGKGYFYISKNSSVNANVVQTIALVDMSTQQYPRKYENTATTDDAGCLYIGYYAVGTVDERNRILRENQILIVEGTYTTETCPDYEPYGYKIPIKISGKNMLDKGLSQIGYCGTYVKPDGYALGNVLWSNLGAYTGQISDWYITNPIPIKPNTVYSYSGLQTANNPAYFFLEEDKTTIINGAAIKTSKRFTTPSNARYIVMSIKNGYVETMMLEEGEITDYEPYIEPITTNIYLNEPLGFGEVLEYSKDNIPKLPTFKGTTIYSVDTTVQPSNMSVTYYATSKE